ncbi:MAG: pyridoxamine 5'-phosphate oxidase family protein [Spirochaetota bacterium]
MTNNSPDGTPLLEKIPGRADVGARLGILAGEERFAALATVSAGIPHLSLIAFAVTPELDELVFATPRNTDKFENILADPRVSVLVDSRHAATDGVMGAEAISLDGIARVLAPGPRREEMAALLLRRHADLAAFLAADSTELISLKFGLAIHVDAFQRVSVGGG